MIDSAAQINIRLIDEILINLSKTSLLALERGCYFLPLYKTLQNLEPYIQNLALYCNERLGAQINLPESQKTDIFKTAEKNYQIIDNIHQFIETQNLETPKDINLYKEQGLMELGSLLRKIDDLPPQEQAIQKYFMRGMIESTIAIILYKKQYKKDDIFEEIDDSDIPEKLFEVLSSCGLEETDENEESLHYILYQECDENLSNNHPTDTQSLIKSLAHNLHKEFSLDENTITPLLQETGESLYQLIKQTKQKTQKHLRASRRLMLFSQNLPVYEPNSVEIMIYGGNPLEQNEQIPLSSTRKKMLPPYLLPFAQTPEFKKLQQQSPYWEKYEKPPSPKTYKDIKALLSVLSLASIEYLYRDFEHYDEILDKLMEKYDNDDEEESDNFIPIDTNTAEQEKELLDFTEKLLELTTLSSKYANLDLNETGVSIDTIKKMQKKENLDAQDINILSELLGTIETNIDDAAEIINLATMPDYEGSAKLINKLPHGPLKKEALSCFSSALEYTFSDLYEEMESILFDIDNIYGHPAPGVDDAIIDFLESGISEYKDLNHHTAEELAQKLHLGILSEYILPQLQNIEPDGEEKEAAMAFIEDYDELSPQTQQYLQNLNQYYAQRVMAFTQKEQKISKETQEQINDYNACRAYLYDISLLQEKVEQLLGKEETIFQKHQQYKKQKSRYELPRNIDLWLTAQMSKKDKHSL